MVSTIYLNDVFAFKVALLGLFAIVDRFDRPYERVLAPVIYNDYSFSVVRAGKSGSSAIAGTYTMDRDITVH